MKPALLLTAAIAGLILASPATSQTPLPPETAPSPPVEAPAQTPDANVEGRTGTVTQSPDTATDGPAAAPPASPAAAPEGPPAPSADAQTPTDAPALASAGDICQPRVTSVHFGARGSALSRDNSNAIEHAVDAASVCTLQNVIIAASGEGRLAQRRAAAARATLIRQGVAEDRITLDASAAPDSATGQVDIRMNFAGVANAGASVATAAAAPQAPTPAPEPKPPEQTNEAEQAPDT